jgi:cell division protease FtsH
MGMTAIPQRILSQEILESGHGCECDDTSKSCEADEDLLRVAYHEAGHALMAWLMGQRPLSATIVPDEDYLGKAEYSAGNWETLMDHLRDRVMVTVAGDACEFIMLDPPPEEFSEPDLWNAVCGLELIDDLMQDDSMVSDGEISGSLNFPEFCEGELEELLEKHQNELELFFAEAKDLLYEDRLLVKAIADALMDKRILSGEEIDSMIDRIIWSWEC